MAEREFKPSVLSSELVKRSESNYHKLNVAFLLYLRPFCSNVYHPTSHKRAIQMSSAG